MEVTSQKLEEEVKWTPRTWCDKFSQGSRPERVMLLPVSSFLHTPALKLESLTGCWVKLVRVLFKPLMVAEHIILVVDGLKVAKEGRREEKGEEKGKRR